LSWLGIILDEDKNGNGDEERVISTGESKINVFVISTDEEKMIAEESWAILRT
jgi:acetate kinase